jgi:phage gp29-like protein
MSIDFEEAAKGTADPHMALIEWCEKTQSKAILGGTLTSSEGSHGTQALGNVHNEVRRELTESDALQLARTINQQLIVPMLQLNKPNVDPACYPKFYFDLSQPEDIEVYSDALPKLVGIGMKIPTQWAHEKLGIPQPEDDSVAVLGTPALAVAANGRQINGLKLAALSHEHGLARHGLAHAQDKGCARVGSTAALSQQPVSEVAKLEQQAAQDQLALETALTEQLTPQRLQAQAEHLLPTLLAKLNQAGGIEQALEMLTQMQPDQDLESLQDDLTQLMFAAEVWGRLSDAGETDV